MWQSYNNNNAAAAVVVCYVFVVLDCILCDQILLLSSSFFFWLGQSSSGAICTTIHLFTHVHGIQHHSSSSIYNMYVVLLQERWYTSIYGMVVLFYSSPLFFSSSQSFSLCYVICSTFLDLSPCSDPLYINSPTTIVVCWQKTLLFLLYLGLSHLHQQLTAASSSSKRYWNSQTIFIYILFFLRPFQISCARSIFLRKLEGNCRIGVVQCVNQFFQKSGLRHRHHQIRQYCSSNSSNNCRQYV